VLLRWHVHVSEECLLNNRSSDALNHDAVGSLSRRLALLALGTAGIGAFAAPSMTEAGKKKRKRKQTVGEKAKQKCLQQVDQCNEFFSVGCAGDVDCQTSAQRCCPVVGTCDVVGFFTCLSTV
jgi:hypothetical protein